MDIIRYLKINKPLIYYFLSGFLGENSEGCGTETVQNFLRNKYIYEFNSIIGKTLKIINFEYDDDNSIFTFSNLINNKYSNDSLKYNFINNTVSVNDNIIKHFNNLIFILGEDNHSTNLVFFINDKYLYILSINTGLGIDNHDQFDGYYSPYYCFKIDITELQPKTQQSSSRKQQSSSQQQQQQQQQPNQNLNMKTSQSIFTSQKQPNRNLNKKMNQPIFASPKPSINPHLNDFINKISCMLMFSKLYNKLDNFNKSFVEYNTVYHDKNINIIKNMANQIGIGPTINNIFNDKSQIKNKINDYINHGFYTLFINYIKSKFKFYNATQDFNKILIAKLTKYNQDNLNNKNNFELNNFHINKRLYLKHRLYLFNQQIYIHKQESGSCSFYSLYWAILIDTLFNHSYDNYILMLKKFEEKMFNEIQKFINFFYLNNYNYNYPFVSTILHKLSNLQILNKNNTLTVGNVFNTVTINTSSEITANNVNSTSINVSGQITANIDIHDNYLYNKHFKYEKSKKNILSNNFIKSYEYLNSLNLLLIPPNLNTRHMFKNDDDDFYNTKIFLSLYNCFIVSPKIFNFDIESLESQPIIPLINALPKNKQFVKIINSKLESAKKEFEDFQNYTQRLPNYLNIYSVQYYYIAKSIVDFCFKNNISDNNIINFCNFIHTFFLFNKLFNCLLKQTLYYYKQNDFNRQLNIHNNYDTIFDEFIMDEPKFAKLYITSTLQKLINHETLRLLFDQSKFINNDDEFNFNDINFFNHFCDNLFKNKSTTYLDGFTINFNFPPPSIDNTNKLKIMRYPEKQLTSITDFLYKYPKYLYHDFNNNYIFNINYFVETNIIEILKNENHKNKLDKYYRHLFFDAVKKNKPGIEIYYFGKKILLLNNYRFESNTYEFRRNSNSPEKEKELIDELLIKEIKDISKTYSNFENLILETDDIETKLTKYNFDITELEMIDCLEEFKLLFNTDNADVFLNKITKIIYIFYENYYLVINNDILRDNEIKISSIIINNKYDVIKRESITDSLFIYFIPSACLSLIYKIGDQYNVLCIASEFNNDECGVLFKKKEISNKYKIFNYSIDSSNLLNLSFDKDPEQIDKLNYFIQNYGVNNLNYIYLKDWNNKGVQEITNNDFNLLSSFNSDNIITDYDTCYKETDTTIKETLSKIVTTDEQKYINYSLIKIIKDIGKTSFAIKPLDKEDSKLKYLLKLNTETETTDPLEKLNFKLSTCIINDKSKNIGILNKFIDEINSKIIEQYNIIKNHIINNKPILDLMYNPINISNYTYLLKLRILCINLLNDLKTHKISDEAKSDEAKSDEAKSDEAICSKIKTIENSLKVMKTKFKYVFEYLFEFILGINVLDEQFDKYVEIINNYSETTQYEKIDKKYIIDENIFNVAEVVDAMVGGTYESYPLHHIMMGKGKSSVLTPLLSLYFCLIDKKKVFIIVPPHLVKQTEKTFNNIIKIFELENDIFIKSDKDIKLDYLKGTTYDNSIFLIDEFDTILDPLKSNFNLTDEECNIDINKKFSNIFKITIKTILDENKEYINNTIECTIKSKIKEILNTIKEIKNSDLIETEIYNVLLNIKNNILKYNINWGIHPEKGYAIPYMNKDTPLLESNFNSIILTLVLTYYYYYTNLYVNVNDNDNSIFDKNLVSTFIYHNLQSFVENEFRVVLSDIPEEIHLYLKKLQIIDQYDLLYNLIVPQIINSIKLCNYQYNLSFVDIINIPNVYKIGYSGTLNIDLPKDLIAEYNFTDRNISVDLDEKYNVYYSLLVNDIMMPKSDDLEKKLNKDSLSFLNTTDYINNINIYNAIIDTTGLFRYESNENIAKILHKILSRPIIYLNNNDDILVFDDDQNQKYDSNKVYTTPFFYYSQKHTVGIDIKQDNYPILNGLCLIDKLNTYTEVAQSVFRLRKLNQGHTIQLFCINNIDIPKPKNIIEILTDNETNNKNLKKENLQYQIIKANIRAKDDISAKDGLTLDIRFKEKVKYFFNDDDDDYDKEYDKKDILQDILAPSTIGNLKMKIDNQQNLIDKIDVKKLVYNLSSLSSSTMEKQTLQTATTISFSELNKLQNSNTINNLIDSNFSDFSHNNIIIDQDIVEKNVILYNDDEYGEYKILFNPSLLTSLTQIDDEIDDEIDYIDKSAYFSPLLIVCKIINDDYLKIILCESTDIFLYNDDLIINHYGNIINKTENNDRLIKLLKPNKFINFLSLNNRNLGNEFFRENIIFFHIFFKIFNSNQISYTHHHDDFIYDIYDDDYMSLNNNNLIKEIEKLKNST
jgi:hypothetical protein